MQIKKSELIAALEKAKPFCGKSFAILENILIDGPAGEIVATDNVTTARIPITCTDFMREVGGNSNVIYPDDELRADLDSLKSKQLESLSEYAGTPVGKKADMITAIMEASQASAEKEATVVEVAEKFCVNPGQLLKIVRSLDLSADDQVQLSVDEFAYQGDELLTDLQATSLSVGENFQQLTLAPIGDFPAPAKHDEINRPFVHIKGTALQDVASIALSDTKNDTVKSFQKIVLFDSENSNIVACDGKRLHALYCEMAILDHSIQIEASVVKKICRIAKDGNIQIQMDAPGEYFAFTATGVNVTTRKMESSFPSYLHLLENNAEHNLLVEKKNLLHAIKQAMLISPDRAEISFNGGLGIVTTSENGVYNRENVSFLKDGKVEPEIRRFYNPKYLHDAIRCMADKVMIRLTNDEDHPLLIQKEKTFHACVMAQKS